MQAVWLKGPIFSLLKRFFMHQEHAALLKALNECIAECNHCYEACLNEEHVHMLARCIELDRDCAEICALTAGWVARGAEHHSALINLCAELCDACAEECEKHAHDHCKKCAEACRKCSEECRSHKGH